MSSETDAEFMERVDLDLDLNNTADIQRLFALARRGAEAADEIERLRDALIEILRTGPIYSAEGGPSRTYKTLYILHLREAVRALGLSKRYNVAWQQAVDRGWAVHERDMKQKGKK